MPHMYLYSFDEFLSTAPEVCTGGPGEGKGVEHDAAPQEAAASLGQAVAGSGSGSGSAVPDQQHGGLLSSTGSGLDAAGRGGGPPAACVYLAQQSLSGGMAR